MGLLPGMGDDMFRLGGVKIFLDGTAHDGTGTPLEDYKFTQPELDGFVERAHGAGLQLIMHCLTEGGPGMGLAAVEAVLAKAPAPLRHRLEHAPRLQNVDEMRRLKRLGMRLTLLPPTAKGAPARRPARYRTLVAEGVEPVCVTDATGTTPNFNPWVSMAAVVARPDEGGGVAPEETVPFDDALRMWTILGGEGGLRRAGQRLDCGKQVGRLRRAFRRSAAPSGRCTLRPEGRCDDHRRSRGPRTRCLPMIVDFAPKMVELTDKVLLVTSQNRPQSLNRFLRQEVAKAADNDGCGPPIEPAIQRDRAFE